jgi:hypothetical protein
MRSAHSILDAQTSIGLPKSKASGGDAARVTAIPGATTVSGSTIIMTVAGTVMSPASQRAYRLARRNAIAAAQAAATVVASGMLSSRSRCGELVDTVAVGASVSVSAADESSPVPASHAQDGSTSVSTLESGGGVCAAASGGVLAASCRQTSVDHGAISGGNHGGTTATVANSIVGDSSPHSNTEQGSTVLTAAVGVNVVMPVVQHVGDNSLPPALESDSDDESLPSGTGVDVFATPAPWAPKKCDMSVEDDRTGTATSANAAASSVCVALNLEDVAFVSMFPIDSVMRELLAVAVKHKLVAKGDEFRALIQRAIEQRNEFKCTPAFVAKCREAVANDGWFGGRNSVEVLEHVAGVTNGFPLRTFGRDLRSPMTFIRNADGVGGGGRQETLTGASVLVQVCASGEATVRASMDVIKGLCIGVHKHAVAGW